jgi:tRNA (uracil-5-)-methyltransferase TRM9
MNTETTEILCGINNDFYRNHCASFSATRTLPWSGWNICLDILKEAYSDDCQNLLILDLACGNLRFESFLQSALPGAPLTYYAVDDCDALLPSTPHVNYQSLDILHALRSGLRIRDQLIAPVCDLSVSFGFMHHVPLQDYREKILLSLIEQTRSGGYVIVSFWQFLNNEVLKEKARVTHEHALKELDLQELDDNDYLLGWKNLPGVYRYCHSFSETEIDQLVEAVANKATLAARFVADGRTDNLNTYLVLKVQ